MICGMKSLNLSDIDPAELMPTPDVPESYGPRNAEERRVPDAFLEQFSIALTLLRDRPNVGSRRFAHLFPDIDLRTWSLVRFPCRLFYMVRGNTLHVLRLDHERREVRADMFAATRKKI